MFSAITGLTTIGCVQEQSYQKIESGIQCTVDSMKVELQFYNDRKGSFPGMLNERKFRVVKVSINNGIGIETVKKYDKIVMYNGKKVVVNL